MRRRYQRSLYADRVNIIRNLLPNASIGVDVIVGFPGETEEDFMETYLFLESLDISYLHVFTYSERDNTPAAEMAGVVPLEIRRARNEKLRSLSYLKKQQFYSQFIGQTKEVLFEESPVEGMMSGFTDNYVKVLLPIQKDLINTIGLVSLKKMSEDFIIAELS
jgi:threonylcarbamoyladenosine tRNA methylthiotransferase MtaB